MQVDTEVFEAITGRLAAVEETVAALGLRVEHYTQMEQIMARAGMPEPMRQAAAKAAPRPARDRHGMRLVGGRS